MATCRIADWQSAASRLPLLAPPPMTHPTDTPDIFRKALAFILERRPFAIATVLRSTGSTPNNAGAKALIERDGTIHGTIGGGAVEAHALMLAASALGSGVPQVFESNLAGAGVHEPGPICGGRMRVLIDSYPADSGAEYARAVQAIEARQKGVWLTTVHHCIPPRITCRFVEANAIQQESKADQLQQCLNDNAPQLLASGPGEQETQTDIFVEPIHPKPS